MEEKHENTNGDITEQEHFRLFFPPYRKFFLQRIGTHSARITD